MLVSSVLMVHDVELPCFTGTLVTMFFWYMVLVSYHVLLLHGVSEVPCFTQFTGMQF